METKVGFIFGGAAFYTLLFVFLGLYATTFGTIVDSNGDIVLLPQIQTFTPHPFLLTPPTEDTSWNVFGWFTAVVNIINFFIRIIIGLINLFIYIINFLLSIITVVQILPPTLNLIIFTPLVIGLGWIIITFYTGS